MSANSIEFSENSGNSGQYVQYFSQMATLIVAFPEYSGHSNQFVNLFGDFSENSGNSYQNKYILPNVKSLALAIANANAYKSVSYIQICIKVYKCIQKCYKFVFLFYPKLHKCNYNMMSFSGHPVCH